MSQLIFIDSNLTDYQSLIDGLPEGSQWIVLDSEKDGVEQILQATSGSTDLDAIQIFSHGSAGSLQLGSTLLTSTNLDLYQQQLEVIGQSLSDTGDILLYGCNVAEGKNGEAFVDRLSALTQADIAASNNLTGADALGGDWDLEYINGAIAAPKLAVDQYQHSLSTLYSDDFSNINSHSSNCYPPTVGIEEQTTNKKLLRITDLLGRETKQTNQPLFYIYDDGTVEKRIVIE